MVRPSRAAADKDGRILWPPGQDTQLHCEVRVVEDADTSGIQIPGHPSRITDAGQRPSDYHTVSVPQHAGDPIVVTFRQRLAHTVPPSDDTRGAGAYARPTGSGYAGIGAIRSVSAGREENEILISTSRR